MARPTALIVLAALVLLAAAPALGQPNCGDPPDMLIVLDRSGSMSSKSGFLSKWSHAVTAVNSLVGSYDSQIRFGLMLFPGSGSSCAAGGIDVGVKNNAKGSIAAKLAMSWPGGNTPIASSLKAAHGYLTKIDPKKTKYVLLVTDGGETCKGKPVDWVKALKGAGIKTYVVGFGSGVDAGLLNGLAGAGGTALPKLPAYYKADSPSKLKQALQSIGSLVSCCGNGILDPGEKCDPKIPAGKTGACPTTCNDGNACTTDYVSGSKCAVVCASKPVLSPKHGDGCCPPGATSVNDNDCKPACGNGVLEAGETCDPKIAAGKAGACKTAADCDDGDPCTVDSIAGSACNVTCTSDKAKPDPTAKDGCCLPGYSIDEDADCPPNCGPDSNEDCIDLCRGVKCPDGQYCHKGKCKPWPGSGDNTKGFEGENKQPAAGGPEGDYNMEGVGCACSTGGGDGPAAGLGLGLLLALLTLLSRRRR